MGVSINGESPIAGWSMENPSISMDDDWGYPSKKPPYPQFLRLLRVVCDELQALKSYEYLRLVNKVTGKADRSRNSPGAMGWSKVRYQSLHKK